MGCVLAIEAGTARAAPDERLTVSFAEAAFILEVSERAVERLVTVGGLEVSALHASRTLTAASLGGFVDLRVDQGVQSLLARWALGQIVEGRLQALRAQSPDDRPPPLLDAVPAWSAGVSNP